MLTGTLAHYRIESQLGAGARALMNSSATETFRSYFTVIGNVNVPPGFDMCAGVS